jgi:hypothetical protein
VDVAPDSTADVGADHSTDHAARRQHVIMRRAPEEKGLTTILGALDKAITDAEWQCPPDRHAFREIAKHSREMHNLLLAVMEAFPQYTPEHLRVYRRTIEDAIRMLEQLRGELPTVH